MTLKVWVFNWFMWYLAQTYPWVAQFLHDAQVPAYTCVEITDHGYEPSNACTDPMPAWKPW
jgi:hypothetical protein